MELTITTTEKSIGVHILSLTGALNSETWPLLEQAVNTVMDTQATVLVFDVRQMNYISSAGIRVILKAYKSMKARQGRIMFSKMQPPVKKVFEIINALPDQNIFTSEAEMDTYLDVMQKKAIG